MKLRYEVDQAEAFRQGIDVPIHSSVTGLAQESAPFTGIITEITCRNYSLNALIAAK